MGTCVGVEASDDLRADDREQLEYGSCPRCGLMIRVTASSNGSSLCPDCRQEGEKVEMERGVVETPR
jgi:uncharacterized OB-fold protein